MRERESGMFTSHASTSYFLRMLGILAIRSERHPSVIASCPLSEGRVTYCGSGVEVVDVCAPIESRAMANALRLRE